MNINDLKVGDSVRVVDADKIMFARDFGYFGGEIVVLKESGYEGLPAIPTMKLGESGILVITPAEFKFLEKLG